MGSLGMSMEPECLRLKDLHRLSVQSNSRIDELLSHN